MSKVKRLDSNEIVRKLNSDAANLRQRQKAIIFNQSTHSPHQYTTSTVWNSLKPVDSHTIPARRGILREGRKRRTGENMLFQASPCWNQRLPTLITFLQQGIPRRNDGEAAPWAWVAMPVSRCATTRYTDPARINLLQCFPEQLW